MTDASDPFADIDRSIAPQQAAAPAVTAADPFSDLDKGPGTFGSMLPVAPYSATDALVHGATLGLSEPVGALAMATGRYLKGQGFDYSQAAREIQRGRQDYAESHPWANLALNLTGGLASFAPQLGAAGPVMGPATMTAPSLIKQTLKSGAIGAGMGALSGAADNSDSLENALLGARYGAEFGGIFGTALPPALAGVPAAAKAAKSALNPTEEALPNAIDRLRGLIANEQKAGGPTVADMAAGIMPGSPTMLADIGGRNIRRELGVLYRSNTPASPLVEQALEGRDAGAGTRLIDAINGGISNGGGAQDALAALQTQRAAAAAPLYEKAFAAGPVYSDRLKQFIDDPIMQAGLAKGIEIQRLESLAAGKPFDPNAYAITFDASGTPRFLPTPNMRTLDAAKQGLDNILDQYRDPLSGKLRLDQRGRAIDSVRRAFTQELDNLNGDYAAARQSWAGPSQAMAALRRGQDFLSLTPDQMRGAVDGMTQAEREFFKLGAADTLRSKVLGTPDAGNEAGAIGRSQLARDRLRPLFDSDAEYDRFIGAVGREANYFKTRYATGLNSMTADRAAADAAAKETGGAESLVWPITTALMAGKPGAAAGAVAAKAAAPLLARMRGQTPEAMTELAHILTTTNPAAQQAYLDMLLPLPRQPAPYLAPTSGLLAARQTALPLFNGLLGASGEGSQ